MAIIPGGTANVMSVELGIPIDIALATNLIVTPHEIRTIDLGKMGDQHFMLRIGIGFEAEMMKNADHDTKARLGNLAYAFSAIQSLQTTQNATYKLTLDGEEVSIDGASCMIANSGNLGRQGIKVAGAVEVDDGLLDVVVIRNIDLPEIASLLANALGGGEALPHWQVREVRVQVDPPQTGICDGELFEATDVTATVIPQALKIITPPAAAPTPAAQT
jgi:diacylglycerol kinase (ATP)